MIFFNEQIKYKGLVKIYKAIKYTIVTLKKSVEYDWDLSAGDLEKIITNIYSSVPVQRKFYNFIKNSLTVCFICNV